MERKENESFEDYKQRRALANEATKNINFRTKHQKGLQGSRDKRRSTQTFKVENSYGAILLGAFARNRIADGTLTAKHDAYVQAQAKKQYDRRQAA